MGVAMTVYGFRRYQDVTREIKARISAELEARNLARHDPLTGLPNRRFFEQELEDCLSTASATRRVAVLMLDLDDFTGFNPRRLEIEITETAFVETIGKLRKP